MSLEAIEARARSRAGAQQAKTRTKRFAEAEQARRLANLKSDGFVIPLSEWIGHNNGPDWDECLLFLEYCWRKASRVAWTPPTQEMGVRRARKAQSLGLSYRRYVLEILERGRFLDEADALQIRNEAGARCS